MKNSNVKITIETKIKISLIDCIKIRILGSSLPKVEKSIKKFMKLYTKPYKLEVKSDNI